MSEAKHTPGPWRVAPPSAYSDGSLNIDAGERGTGGYICRVGLRNDPQAVADARLIATAPDLLAVLQTILAENNTRGFLHPALDRKVDAAIAKATGAA